MFSTNKFRRSLSAVVPIAVVACTAGYASDAQAQTTITRTLYSNVTNFAGIGYSPAGATAATPITALAADDIQLAPGFLGPVTSMQFSVGNLGTTTVSARPIVSIYANSTTATAPGALLTTITFNPISFTSGNVTTYTYTPGSTIFTAPTSGFFWAGISFDNGGTSTATVAQLNTLGIGVFTPPTLGSSNDYFFKSTNPGVGGTSNPAGGLVNFGGSPAANFGFSFTGTASAPEPSAVALSLSGAMLMVGGIVRRRRARA